MIKIAFIGGGSLQWTPGLVNDIALTKVLDGTELVLHDIDVQALKRMTPLCKRIIARQGSKMRVRAALERRDALAGADFVVLCVGIGGLEAMRQDLEIPLKYGIHQSVGDTVGPGGLARGLRHIPFALQVAQEMVELCPEGWLLNLTNPMTTICRAISKGTQIRTVGLCHEVNGVRLALASLFNVSPQEVLMEVAGINHLPVILNCRVGEADGLGLLHAWLSEHDIFEFVEPVDLVSPFQVFRDYLAVKFHLFAQMGVLFGAGDRHVAEFFPGFLDESNQFGKRFGVQLTTVDHRLEMACQRSQELADFSPAAARSDEQLAPLMGALLGDPPGQFVVNVPNQGQIENLPRGAVVECQAYADSSGIWPLGIGALSPAVHAVIAPHVDRQELIVEAALSGRYELAKAALATDPLVHDPMVVEPMFAELVTANIDFIHPKADRIDEQQRQEFLLEIEHINAQPIAEVPHEAVVQSPGKLSVGASTLQELIEHPAARAILEQHFPGMVDNPQLKMAYGMTLKQVAPFAPQILSAEKLSSVDEALSSLDPV